MVARDHTLLRWYCATMWDIMALEQQYREQSDTLRHVLLASNYATQLMQGSPFRALTIFERFKLWVRTTIVRCAEIVLGAPLYAENMYREMILLEPRARLLLTQLLKKNLVTNWRIGSAVPDQPYIVTCRLDLRPITLPSGKVVSMHGNTGGGVGKNLSEALIPALAELLERYSMAVWSEQLLVKGTYPVLQGSGAVDPQAFTFFSHTQLADEHFAEHRIDAKASLHWTHARTLAEGRTVLIPAQLVYMFYENEHPDEVIFWDTTSNGTAAGASVTDATYRAICEAIERDAFMIFWLNRITPPRVRPESIPDPEVQRLLCECERYGLTVHILDCTTDLGVPTFVGVVIDRHGNGSVAVTAGADFDVLTSLRKLMYEVLKFMHGTLSTGSEGTLTPNQIISMGQREHYWNTCDWATEIDFLIRGPEKSYDDIVIPKVAHASYAEKLEALRWILKKKKYHCYVVDVTTPEAHEAGLSIVRAIIPDLMPIYFKEAKRYQGVARLYTVPACMGYANGAKDEFELNPTPHPFL